MLNNKEICNSKKIVTLGIFAHANAGKTTLTENILFKYGIIKTLGRVDSGNTVTDSLLIEKQRGITIRTSYVSFTNGDKTIQLLDTPGHIDFSSEVVRAINVLDVAILVISGVEGIEAQTKVIWDMLNKRKIPTFIFINKLDRMGASYVDTLDKIRLLLTERAVSFVDIKLDCNISVNKKNVKMLFEDCIINDPKILEKYLNGEIAVRDFNEYISQLLKSNAIYPVYGGSTLYGNGIDVFLDGLLEYMPYTVLTPDNHINDNVFSAYIYMVKSNANTKEAFVKILKGSLKNRSSIKIDGQENKIVSIEKNIGNKRTPSNILLSGELAIVKGLDVNAGQIIGEPISEKSIFNITPIFSVSLSANKTDIETFHEALKDLNTEDPNLNLRYNVDSRQFQIDVMGELQTESIVGLLQERYNILCFASTPKIIYRETPKREGYGISSYTGMSLVELRVKPEAEGTGVQFATSVTTSELPDKYQKQVRRLVFEYLDCGIYGWPVTDVTVELIGGKWDNAGSQSSHFNIATPVALARALRVAGSKLLEPTVEYQIIFGRNNINQVLDEVSALQYRYEICKPIKSNSIELSGRAFISEFTCMSTQLRKLLKGEVTIDYYQSGYSYNKNNNIIKNDLPSSSAFDINTFLRKAGMSIRPLDNGLGKTRGKPKKIKRNSRFWKKK